MYKELLRSIVGIEIFPIISLCLFFGVFTLVVIKACRLDGRSAARLARLPLDEPNLDTARKKD